MFCVAEFSREKILDLVKGESIDYKKVDLTEIESIDLPEDMLLGVWRFIDSSKLPLLPQLILGKRQALEDLLAWTTTYVPGLFPLSSLVRMMAPSTFRGIRKKTDIRGWNELTGAAVGLMYGELLSYANNPKDLSEINYDMCRSTLTYVLFRCIALGGGEEDVSKVAEDWIRLRLQAGLETRTSSCNLIFDITKELVFSEDGLSIVKIDDKTNFRKEIDLLNQIEMIDQGRGILKNTTGMVKETNLTAEERVLIFDEIASRIVIDRGSQERQKSKILGQIAFWCRNGFSNQWAILRRYSAELPESAIWLGALQAHEPLADTLFSGRSVGWKLALELYQGFDLFDAPKADFSIFELDIGKSQKEWERLITHINKQRIEIELSPGVTTFMKSGRHYAPLQRELPMDMNYEKERKELSKQVKELRDIESSMEKILKTIKLMSRENK